MKILITGGAGFIGSNFVHFILQKYQNDELTILDDLTYAGRKENLAGIIKDIKFVKSDITNRNVVDSLIKENDTVVNFAAETHVDKSILTAGDFIKTNVFGVYTLIEAAYKYNIKRFLQISTDEIYGSIENGSFTEVDRLNPSNPYAASKAAADLLTMSFFTTHNIPLLITRSCNNFGPYEHIEKFIPKAITNAIKDKPIPIYGDGTNVRDWIFVRDNCEAIDTVLRKGKVGEIYNIAADNEMRNIDVVKMILEIMGKPLSLIKMVKDRPGHDKRYSTNYEKIKALGWKPRSNFEEKLKYTIKWYEENQKWWKSIRDKEFHTKF